MSQLAWNEVGDRFYETGVDRGVLYPNGARGVVWNGLTSVQKNVSGGETESYYFDGVKYLDVVAGEDFQATLEALTYPDEFAECEGVSALTSGLFATNQTRATFGLCYRTKIGNDLEGIDHGYKLHLIYNATAAPSTRQHQTLSNAQTPSNFQWTLNAVPVVGPFRRPTAYFVVDSTKVEPERLAILERHLYGQAGVSDPYLPTQENVIAILEFPFENIPEPVIYPDQVGDYIIDGGAP